MLVFTRETGEEGHPRRERNGESNSLTCKGFSYEIYAMHALGLAEDPELSELSLHLERGCETCENALKDSLEFWYLMNLVPEVRAAGPVGGPSPELKARIMRSIVPASRWRAMVGTWSAERIAAGVAVLVMAGSIGWSIAHMGGAGELHRAQAQIAEQQSMAQRLDAENRDLRNRAAAPAPAVPAPSAAPAIPSHDSGAALAALQQQLNDARTASAAADAALTAERARVADLQRNIADQTAQLAAITRNRDDLDARLRDSQSALAQTNQRAAQQDAQLATVRAQVSDLQNQIVRFQRVIDNQRQDLAEHLRLTAMLQSPSAKLVALRGTEAGPNSAGVALISGDGNLVFFASNLPPLPDRRVYQLWVMRNRGPAVASAGTFTMAGRDAPAIQLRNAQLVAGVTALAVTDEPAGGSPLPTGHKLMIGTAR